MKTAFPPCPLSSKVPIKLLTHWENPGSKASAVGSGLEYDRTFYSIRGICWNQWEWLSRLCCNCTGRTLSLGLPTPPQMSFRGTEPAFKKVRSNGDMNTALPLTPPLILTNYRRQWTSLSWLSFRLFHLQQEFWLITTFINWAASPAKRRPHWSHMLSLQGVWSCWHTRRWLVGGHLGPYPLIWAVGALPTIRLC